MVFRSSRVRNSVANLAQSRLIDARSVSIIHESFSLLVIMLGIATILNLYCVCEIDANLGNQDINSGCSLPCRPVKMRQPGGFSFSLSTQPKRFGCLERRYRQPPHTGDNGSADIKNDEYSFADKSTHNSPPAGIRT